MTGKRRIDRITSDAYLEGIASRSLAEVRSLRDECREEETGLSFERRLLHGRMDILRAELERRTGGGESLIDRLAAILAGDDEPSTRGAYPGKDPIIDFDQPKRRVEKLISDDTLANVGTLPADDLEKIIGLLSDAEREVSESRRAVQRVLDSLNAEIARRYKSGEANPADMLAT